MEMFVDVGVRVIKPTRISWTRYEEYIYKKQETDDILVRVHQRSDDYGDLGTDHKITKDEMNGICRKQENEMLMKSGHKV
jgi:hypothetical protein